MFQSLFDSEKPIWRGMSLLADILLLSLFWFFLSLPLFTLGASTAALYDATVKCVRAGKSGALSRFFQTFRREFAVSVPAVLISGAVLAGLLWILRQLWGMAFSLPQLLIPAAAYLVLLCIPVGAICWMFPLLSRFTFQPLGLLRVSLQFALAHLPSTLLVVLLLAVAWALSVTLLLPMLVAPCLTALAWSLVMERAFQKHMPPESRTA